jgi:competence ComEA-like helix-hairpin-helix protein
VASATTIVDVDRATAEELETLPRIGPALARRIAADRESNGAFGSLEALQRVKGIGPALARQLAPHVTFSAIGAWRASPGPARSSSDPGSDERRPSQIIWRSPRPP